MLPARLLRRANVLVKMLETVGYCKHGLVYRVDRRVADRWIQDGRAEHAQVNVESVEKDGPVTPDGEPAFKVPRKRRRRKRKH